jgi:hypothetical protein
MADRFGIYSASFTHAGGTLALQQLDEQEHSSGSRKKTIRPGGALNPAAHILSTANPRIRFSTCDCYTVLAAMGGNLHVFCSGGHIMRYQKRQPGGAFKTGSDHFLQSTAQRILARHVDRLRHRFGGRGATSTRVRAALRGRREPRDRLAAAEPCLGTGTGVHESVLLGRSVARRCSGFRPHAHQHSAQHLVRHAPRGWWRVLPLRLQFDSWRSIR